MKTINMLWHMYVLRHFTGAIYSNDAVTPHRVDCICGKSWTYE